MGVTVFKDLLGKTLKSVERDGDQVRFVTDDGKRHLLRPEDDCCNSVTLEDVSGDLNSLVGSPLLTAEESTSDASEEEHPNKQESATWSFYRFATLHGDATIRFYGTSNGYYAETAYLCEES